MESWPRFTAPLQLLVNLCASTFLILTYPQIHLWFDALAFLSYMSLSCSLAANLPTKHSCDGCLAPSISASLAHISTIPNYLPSSSACLLCFSPACTWLPRASPALHTIVCMTPMSCLPTALLFAFATKARHKSSAHCSCPASKW